jgi:hypothetical protein
MGANRGSTVNRSRTPVDAHPVAGQNRSGLPPPMYDDSLCRAQDLTYCKRRINRNHEGNGFVPVVKRLQWDLLIPSRSSFVIHVRRHEKLIPPGGVRTFSWTTFRRESVYSYGDRMRADSITNQKRKESINRLKEEKHVGSGKSVRCFPDILSD